MRLFWTLLFLLLSFVVMGQETGGNADQYLRKTLEGLARQTLHKQRDSLTYYRLEIQRLMPAVKDPNLQAGAYLGLGNYYQGVLLNMDSAATWYQKAADVLQRHPSPAMDMRLWSAIAWNYYMQSNFTMAEKYALESLDKARKLGDRRQEAACLNTLASIMLGYVDQPQKAREYYQQCLSIVEELRDTLRIIHSCIGLANALNSLHRSAEALECLTRARHLVSPAIPLGVQAEIAYWQSYILIQMERYDEALRILQQTLPLFERLQDRGRIMHILLDFSGIEIKKGNPDSAIAHCKRILNTAWLNPGLYESTEAYRLLYEAYKQKGDTRLALFYHERLTAVEDSMRRINKAKDIAELEMRFQNKEKAAQLARQTQALEQSNNRQRNIFIGLVLSLAALGTVFYALLRVRKARRRLAEQNEIIRQQKEALQQVDRMKSRFFANVSHELRTPLTLVLGPLQSMRRGNRLEARDTVYANLAYQHGQQLLQLVNEILDLSKMESGKMQLHETAVSLQPFLQQLVSTFEGHAEQRGILLRFDYQLDKRLRVLVDEDKLRKVLNNLLSNAMKFTPPHAGSPVWVTVEEAQGCIRISVHDTGRGIHPDDLPHVFERFFQTAQPNAPEEGGTGIGLALCREFAELMEGRVWADSTLGKGSSFYFEFPVKEPVAAGAEHPELDDALLVASEVEEEEEYAAPVANGNALPRPSILIVEDNEDLREYVRLMLVQFYQVQTAANGQIALDMLQAGAAPQLIISDIMMPVLDGFQLLDKLKSDDRWRHIPMVMLTARADIRDKLRALRTGVDDYLLKPFEEDELLTRVINLLRNYQNRQVLSPKPELPDNPAPESLQRITAADQAWLVSFEILVEKRLGDFNLTAEALASDMAMSRASFFRQLKRLTGLTPAQYLDEARFLKARQLLEQRQVSSVKAAAYAVGFRQVKHFSQNYKKRFGKLPSGYAGE